MTLQSGFQSTGTDRGNGPGVKKRVVALRSVGCRTNQEEMTTLGFTLADNHFKITDSIEEADIIILNSCSVTSSSQAKTKRMIGSLARKNRFAQICVTGCMAQQMGEEILAFPNVSWVVGNGHKSQIPDILLNEEKGVFVSSLKDREPSDFPVPINTRVWQGRTRFPLKIQEGCDFRCSYCIVPSLRGPSASISFDSIKERFRKAVGAGFKEIVITGTHIGQFRRRDVSGLCELLSRLLTVRGEYRIRLSSLDPRDLEPNILKMVGEERKICNHIHVSVQSFSPDVLKSMNRPYADLENIAARLKEFRDSYIDAGIGGDFIVGFPGETDSQFIETLETVKKIGFSYGHVFRYSKRPGTPAAQMKNQTEETVKKQRSERLRNELTCLQNRFIRNIRHIGQKIIVERESPVQGITSNYIRVEALGMRAPKNSLIEVFLSSGKTNSGRWEALPCGEKHGHSK